MIYLLIYLFILFLLLVNYNFYQVMKLTNEGYLLQAITLFLANIAALIGISFLMKYFKQGY
mgnify:CR=1 FL=1